MKFNRKQKEQTGIPTASMPDIVFMLLIFFMVSTILKTEEGLRVDLPDARMIEKLETKKYVTYIWVAKNSDISIDDKLVEVSDIRAIIYERLVEDPRLIVSFRTDKQVNFGLVSDIHEELREANALRINYSAKPLG